MITILSPKEIISAANNIKRGAFVSFEYKAEVPLKAEYRKAGWRVTKICKKLVRFGVSYKNIASVIDRKAKQAAEGYEPRKVANHWVSIIDNVAAHNTNTNKDYLCVTNSKANRKSTKVVYSVITPEGEQIWCSLASLDKKMVIDSYWNPSKTGGDVFKVSFENVIRINNTGVSYF